MFLFFFFFLIPFSVPMFNNFCHLFCLTSFEPIEPADSLGHSYFLFYLAFVGNCWLQSYDQFAWWHLDFFFC